MVPVRTRRKRTTTMCIATITPGEDPKKWITHRDPKAGIPRTNAIVKSLLSSLTAYTLEKSITEKKMFERI
jgi:Trm5-related predicted tRNA methylase